MKKIILSLVLLLTLVSCEVYDQPKTLSLSGEYIIDRITRTSTENTSGTQQLVVYQPGDTFISNTESFPMDIIVVGATRWHFDYSVISFSPVGLNNGQVLWQYQYFYQVYNNWYNTDLGHIEFELNNGTKRMFKIVDDGGIPREHKARLMDEFTVMACNPADPDNNLPVMELILETSASVIVKTLVPINRRAYEADIEKLWANYRSANTAFNLAQANTPEKEALRKEKTSLSGKAYAMINRYPDLRHAYAMTVHRSQGSTFDTALVHYADLNTMRSAFEFNRALYVACTRPRQYLAVVV